MYPPRRLPPKPAKPQLPPPLLAELEAEFQAKPFGGFAGEWTVPRNEPAPLSTPHWTPPPPDWAAELAEREPDPAPAGPAMTAHEAMMAHAHERGELEEKPAPAWPPITIAPLRRPEFPPPDWRQEERERAAAAKSQRVGFLAGELEPQPQKYPAKKTPRLNRIRAELQALRADTWL